MLYQLLYRLIVSPFGFNATIHYTRFHSTGLFTWILSSHRAMTHPGLFILRIIPAGSQTLAASSLAARPLAGTLFE